MTTTLLGGTLFLVEWLVLFVPMFVLEVMQAM